MWVGGVLFVLGLLVPQSTLLVCSVPEVSFDKKLAFYLCFEVLSLVKHCNSSMNNIMQYV